MAKVTLLEARNLLNQTEEQVCYYRELLFQKSNVYNPVPTSVTSVSEEPDGTKEVKKEVIPKSVSQSMSVDSLMKKMDELYVERNKLQVALTAAEATVTIEY